MVGGRPARCRRADPYPPSLTIALEKVETLRYGENPHQPAARYRRPGSTAGRRPVRERRAAAPGQGAVLQQRPRRGRGRGARASPARPGLRHRQAHQPVRRRRAARSLVEAWDGRARRRTRSARSAGVVALTRPVDAALAGAARLDLPRGRRGAGLRAPARSTVLAGKPNLRARRRPDRSADDGPAPGARSDGLDPHRRRRGARHRPRHRRRRPGDLDGRDPARADGRGAARPRPRLAAGPRRHVERDRARARRPAGRARDRARPRGSTRPAAPSRRPRPMPARRARPAPRAPRTRSTRSPTRSRSASRPA